MQRTIVIRRDYLHYVRKYSRFEKRHKNMSVHLSPAFRLVSTTQSFSAFPPILIPQYESLCLHHDVFLINHDSLQITYLLKTLININLLSDSSAQFSNFIPFTTLDTNFLCARNSSTFVFFSFSFAEMLKSVILQRLVNADQFQKQSVSTYWKLQRALVPRKPSRNFNFFRFS